ncbi:GNAT family N-acetyltransferase [Streptomyces chryseus]|uniref:GNAT family N-acetyltransferase n=1 Tax=Streptomyces chryseus TaxID=68186 RepID=UPI00110FC50E|nr:GNAT family protein [Streptomyces chryseus]GGX26426.1 hypothetical protein GCM10010353_46770 [Streptomyces chryseus]
MAGNFGSTRLGSRFQRTGINDHRNECSQRAVERLGARREGVLRGTRIRPDGTMRDTVVHSILADEWTAARDALTSRLTRP